jgi:hypothetical protein
MEGKTLIEVIGVDEQMSNKIIDYMMGIMESDDAELSVGDVINHWRSEYENGNLKIGEFAHACYVTGFLTADPSQVELLFRVYHNRKNQNKTNPKDVN